MVETREISGVRAVERIVSSVRMQLPVIGITPKFGQVRKATGRTGIVQVVYSKTTNNKYKYRFLQSDFQLHYFRKLFVGEERRVVEDDTIFFF